MRTSIQTVPLAPRVAIRDDFFLLENEKMPLVLISPGPGNETIRLKTFDKNLVYEYEVLVAYLVAGNRLVESDLKGFMDMRERIRNRLYQIAVPGLQQAWDTNIEIGAVNKFSALANSNYRVTGWGMKYAVAEVRQGN